MSVSAEAAGAVGGALQSCWVFATSEPARACLLCCKPSMQLQAQPNTYGPTLTQSGACCRQDDWRGLPQQCTCAAVRGGAPAGAQASRPAPPAGLL